VESIKLLPSMTLCHTKASTRPTPPALTGANAEPQFAPGHTPWSCDWTSPTLPPLSPRCILSACASPTCVVLIVQDLHVLAEAYPDWGSMLVLPTQGGGNSPSNFSSSIMKGGVCYNKMGSLSHMHVPDTNDYLSTITWDRCSPYPIPSLPFGSYLPA
jgi:hypothetical protein